MKENQTVLEEEADIKEKTATGCSSHQSRQTGSCHRKQTVKCDGET